MKKRKKRKSKKIYWYWLLVDLAVVVIVLALLLYKPAGYDPPELAPASNKHAHVSGYLTHELLPQLYNGAQRREPFDLIVTQEGINSIVAWSKWPKQSNGIRFSLPEVLFIPNQIVLMTTASFRGVELAVTVVVEPNLQEESAGGGLNLRVAKVKVGAMNITLPAKMVARRMYLESAAGRPTAGHWPDTEDLAGQIAASLLNDEPFDPVFRIHDKKVRVKKIIIAQQRLKIHLAPAY